MRRCRACNPRKKIGSLAGPLLSRGKVMVDIARKSSFRSNVLLTIGVLLLLVGLFFGGKRLYRKYEPMRLAGRASTLIQKGDETNARLTLRRALGINPNDVGSLRLMAELADKHRDPSAVA